MPCRNPRSPCSPRCRALRPARRAGGRGRRERRRGARRRRPLRRGDHGRGTLTEVGAPLAGQPVVLEARRFPFTRRWLPLATATTDATGASPSRASSTATTRSACGSSPRRAGDGAYVPPRGRTLSPVRVAYVLPSFTLAFEQLRRGRIRITQVYPVPADVRLTPARASTSARQGGPRAPGRAARPSPTRRVRAGPLPGAGERADPRPLRRPLPLRELLPVLARLGHGRPGPRCPRRFARLR